MGQEAYAMFPALAEMQARAQLMKAQAAGVGQDTRFAQQKYGDQQAAEAAFGRTDWSSPVPGGMPSPGGPSPPPPQPGQASQPSAPGFRPFKPAPAGIRVPPPGGPAMGGPVDTGPVDTVGRRAADLPQAAQPPVPPVQAESAPHKWTAAPGEQYDTPDGSRPRSLGEVFAALKKANPKADPATLARAAAIYLPWMTEQDQMEVKKAVAENTAAVHASDQAAITARAVEKNDLTQLIAEGKNDTALQIADMKVKAAQQRVDSVNQRMREIAANTLKLGQEKLEEARRSKDGTLALARQGELRRQQNSITQLQDTYNRGMGNLQFVPKAEQEAYLGNLERELTQGMETLQNLPDPTIETGPPPETSVPGATPDTGEPEPEPAPTDPDALDRRFHTKKRVKQESSLRTPSNSKLALAKRNAARRKYNLPPLSAMT